MGSLFIVRHGETEWNRERRLLGNRPIPLTDLGRQQLLAVARRLPANAPFSLYSSPLVRTRQSADLIASAHGLEVVEDRRLIEVQAEPWEGRSFDELAALPEFRAALKDPAHPPPGFEPITEVRERVIACVESVWDPDGEQHVVLVSHGDVVRAALAHFLGLELRHMRRFRVDNGSISRIDGTPWGPTVRYVNLVP